MADSIDNRQQTTNDQRKPLLTMPALTSRSSSSSSSSSRKRITIKPFSRPPKLPPLFYEKTSQKILEAVSWEKHQQQCNARSSGSGNSNSLQDSYQSVVKLVSHKFGPKLYVDLVQELKKSTALVLEHPTKPILDYISTQYPKYVDYLLLVRHVFLALDRPYVWQEGSGSGKDRTLEKRTATTMRMASDGCKDEPQRYQPPLPNPSGPSGTVLKRTSQTTGLLEVGLHQFALRLKELQLDVDLYQEWWDLLWQKFQDHESSPLLNSTMGIWSDLQWKFPVIQQTQPRLEQSLRELSQSWKVVPYSGEKFLSYTYQQWVYVSQHWTFLPKTWLRTLLETHLFEPHLSAEHLLNDLDITNLPHCQKLWLLAGRLGDGLPRVLSAVCKLSKKDGLDCLAKDQKTVVPSLLDLQEKLRRLQEVVGELPLKSVWNDVLNEEPNKVAECLAKHVDTMFRNSKAEVTMEPVLQLFCFLQAKDVFEAFYKKDLAKRLLWNRIQSMDVERQFVSLLKAECGAGYTSKMEGMFQDIEWSRETMNRYKTSPEYHSAKSARNGSASVDMDVQILTTGYWPVYPQYSQLVLPPTLVDLQTQFLAHYKQKYQGRKIVWQYAVGNCLVRFTLPQRQYDLVVGLSQALVLGCFNDGAQRTMEDVSKEIGLDDTDELEKILQSLSMGKDGTRVLRLVGKPTSAAKSPPPSGGKRPAQPPSKGGPRPIRESDMFVVNDRFHSKQRRIRIANMSKRKSTNETSEEERAKVLEAVTRDRLYLIDAVLVRIMKARKTILHQQLIPQVTEQVKFGAQPSDIKKRIESLIEREYMERDQKDRHRYNYLA